MARRKYHIKMTTPFTDGVVAAIRIGSFAALCILGFLLYLQFSGNLTTLGGCGEKWSCADVFSSKWGVWFGVPVTVLALAAYASLFVLSMKPVRKLSVMVDVMLGALGAALLLTSIWFIGVQITYRVACTFCLLLQLVGLVIGGIIVQSTIRAIMFQLKVRAPAMFTLAFVLAGLLIAGQLVSKGVTLADDEEPIAEGDATFDGTYYKFPNLGISIEKGKFPTMGNSRSSKAVVVLLDYSTYSGKRIHEHLSFVLEKLGEELAIIVIPVPLDGDCCDYWDPEQSANACQTACYAYAAWEASPDIYRSFHDRLIEGGSGSSSGSIGGMVWHDTNSNGVVDAGEKGISGLKLDLTTSSGGGTLNRSQTDASGAYVFSNLSLAKSSSGFSYQIVLPETNFDTGGGLNGMVNTFGYGDTVKRTQFYELTNVRPTLTGKNLGFVEASRYDEGAIRADAADVQTEVDTDSGDPILGELKRLAGQVDVMSLLPDFAKMEAPAVDGEQPFDWAEARQTMPVIEKLVSGNNIFGDLKGPLLPLIIFGSDQRTNFKESKEDLVKKIARATNSEPKR